jgi:hypothetical protein
MKNIFLGVGFIFFLLVPVGIYQDSLGLVFLFMSFGVFFIYLSKKIRRIEQTNVKEDNLAKLNTLIHETGLIKTHFYLDSRQENAILIDEKKSMIALFNKVNDEYKKQLYDFSQVIATEIYEDEMSVVKTDRSSQLGGALVGGVLAGGFGAIIGGLSGKEKVNKQAKKLTLRITLDDLTSPLQQINFLNLHNPIPRDNPLYKESSEEILKWHNVFAVIINRQSNKATS